MSADKSGESAVEHAVQLIKDHIRTGAFAPGQRLVATDLMKITGVSAGPVREAVRKLTGEGLVEIQPFRGAVVQSLSRADIVDIYSLREVIEGLAARLAAMRIDVGDNRESFTRAYEAMRAAFRARDFARYNDTNHQFHDAIFRMTGNSRLVRSAEQLFLPIYVLRYHALLEPETTEVSASEHDRIARAILDGDPEAAERAMRRHVRTSGEAICARLGTDVPLR